MTSMLHTRPGANPFEYGHRRLHPYQDDKDPCTTPPRTRPPRTRSSPSVAWWTGGTNCSRRWEKTEAALFARQREFDDIRQELTAKAERLQVFNAALPSGAGR